MAECPARHRPQLWLPKQQPKDFPPPRCDAGCATNQLDAQPVEQGIEFEAQLQGCCRQHELSFWEPGWTSPAQPGKAYILSKSYLSDGLSNLTHTLKSQLKFAKGSHRFSKTCFCDSSTLAKQGCMQGMSKEPSTAHSSWGQWLAESSPRQCMFV